MNFFGLASSVDDQERSMPIKDISQYSRQAIHNEYENDDEKANHKNPLLNNKLNIIGGDDNHMSRLSYASSKQFDYLSSNTKQNNPNLPTNLSGKSLPHFEPFNENQREWLHSEFLADKAYGDIEASSKLSLKEEEIDDCKPRKSMYDPEEIKKRNEAYQRSLHLSKGKNDNRLFPDHLLYCEGMPRPAFRGMLHLVCALLFPLGMWHIIGYEANNHLPGQIAGFIYLFGNFFCCLVSATYHIGNFPPGFEIFIQKLDHCGIAICTAGINFPVSILLLPHPYGCILASLSTITCLWTCWNVFHQRPGVWRLVCTASMIMYFLPILYYYMTIYEFCSVLGNIFFQCVGVYIFTRKHPDPYPLVFGYHEVFHVFTVLGFLSVYFCNWSVIRRTCNPYLHQRDIFEDLLFKMIFGA